MKLLWLTGWYPNKTEPYAGDFIQRHAAAVALYHEVEVIHLVRDPDGIVTKDVLVGEDAAAELKALRRMKKQYERLKLEHEILKKAIAFTSARRGKSSSSSKPSGKRSRSE